MKKLLTLLLALTLLPVPLSFAASDQTIETQDLHDYLMFEEGSWWTYDTTVTDLYSDTITTTESTVTQSECTETDDCFTLTEATELDSTETVIRIEDDTAYYSNLNETQLAQDYVKLSLDSYSQMMPDEDYAAFGFTTFDAGATSLSCDSELDTEYSFNDETHTAIVEECTLTTSIDGTRFRVLATSNYVKGIGMVSSTAKAYYGTIELIDTEVTLTDSSLSYEVSPFSDVESTDTNFAAIDYLTNEEVFSGYEDGTFLPENTVNRAELLKILVEAKYGTPDETTYQNCFTDVGTDWYAKYVCYAEEQGWVEGYLDGSFKPADPVNKVEALKMLLLSQGVDLETDYRYVYDDVNEEDWFMSYVVTAQSMGILEEDGQYFSPDADRDRKGIAENLYRLLLNLEIDNFSDLMSELACLYYEDTSRPYSDVEDEVMTMLSDHGYENEEELQAYIESIRDFSFFQDFEAQLSADIESSCAADVEASGETPESVAASVL